MNEEQGYMLAAANTGMPNTPEGVGLTFNKPGEVGGDIKQWRMFCEVHNLSSAPASVQESLIKELQRNSPHITGGLFRERLNLRGELGDVIEDVREMEIAGPAQLSQGLKDLSRNGRVTAVTDNLTPCLRMILECEYDESPGVSWIREEVVRIEGDITVEKLLDYTLNSAHEILGVLYLGRHLLKAGVIYRVDYAGDERVYPTLTFPSYFRQGANHGFLINSHAWLGGEIASGAKWVLNSKEELSTTDSTVRQLLGDELTIGHLNYGVKEILEAHAVKDGSHFRCSLLMMEGGVSERPPPFQGPIPRRGMTFVYPTAHDPKDTSWPVVTHSSLEVEKNAVPIQTTAVLPKLPLVRVWVPHRKEWGYADVRDLKPHDYADVRMPDVEMRDPHREVLERLIATAPASLKVAPATVILLWGPPGTGKTTTALAFANECKQLPVDLYGFDLMTPAPKRSPFGLPPLPAEDQLQTWYLRTWELGIVLAINEADSILYDRAVDPGNASRLSTFLRFLDTVSGFVFLTTNRPESLDPAVLSRVAVSLRFDELSPAYRKAVWLREAAKYKLELTEDTAAGLAKMEDLDGRQIAATVRMFSTFGGEWVAAQSVAQLKDLITSVQERPETRPQRSRHPQLVQHLNSPVWAD